MSGICVFSENTERHYISALSVKGTISLNSYSNLNKGNYSGDYWKGISSKVRQNSESLSLLDYSALNCLNDRDNPTAVLGFVKLLSSSEFSKFVSTNKVTKSILSLWIFLTRTKEIIIKRKQNIIMLERHC